MIETTKVARPLDEGRMLFENSIIEGWLQPSGPQLPPLSSYSPPATCHRFLIDIMAIRNGRNSLQTNNTHHF